MQKNIAYFAALVGVRALRQTIRRRWRGKVVALQQEQARDSARLNVCCICVSVRIWYVCKDVRESMFLSVESVIMRFATI